MAKQLNVNLGFTAETSQAKAKIMELQATLSKIAVGTNLDVKISPEKLKQASAAAQELSIHLNNAFNSSTGNFDLSKLDKSLAKSKTSVAELSASLLNAGTTGQQAFVQLAQSIAAADRPMIGLKGRMAEFATTLKNTARWQISSSILHGFMGAIQSAYGYAQDLNRSLNDIRIVTGYSADQMADFAVEANKAAKSLSTTTNEYTKASLIYFQQGLSTQEVKERADVTIKMANVSQQSAEVVSDQMTAVWNNFYDGSKSLEYYADVMTALGAKTASSADEIAGGLEKFAAIGDTIGLSYEYAASALATITSNTRQSEEVVGTALKTIFARIQGLKMGETLDDGLDLNKYSEALQTVGISIFDSTGELKKMDNILDEMGNKWNELSKAQQVALAQTVAGVRQYTQLVALMDNWNNGDNDSFQANLDTANMAEGSLQEQADIYEESWEAASNRVRASLESIFTDVIDDNFFIELTNGFASLLDSIHALIDGMGGIKPLLLGIGGFFLSSISHKITPALQELGHTFSVVFQGAEKRAKNLAQEMNNSISTALSNQGMSTNSFSTSDQQALTNAYQLNEAKAKLNVISKTLTDTEKQQYETQLQILQIQQSEAQALADSITAKQEELKLLAQEMDYENALRDLENQRASEEKALLEERAAARDKMAQNPSDTGAVEDYEAASAKLAEHRQKTDELTAAREAYTKALYDTYAARAQEQAQNPTAKLSEEISMWQLMPEHMNNYRNALINITKESDSGAQRKMFVEIQKEIETVTKNSLPELSKQMNNTFKKIGTKDFNKAMAELIKYLQKAKIPAKDLEKILGKLGQGKNVNNLKKNYKTLGNDLERLKQKQIELNESANKFNPTHVVTGIERISKTAAGLGQLAMTVSSIRSMFAAWNNDDLSFGEKLTTTLMSISMIVPGVIGMFNSFKTALISTQAIQIAQTGTTYLQSAAITGLTTTVTAEQVAEATGLSLKQAAVVAEQANIIAKTNALAASGALAAGMTAENLAQATGMTQTQAETVLKGINAGMTTGQAMAEAGLTTSRAAGLGSLIANTAATIANTAAKVMNLAMSGPWGWAILAAGVALGVATVALIANTNETEKATAAQQTNAQTTQNLSDAYNKATEAANEFRNAVSDYKEGVNGLQNLQKGTEEYTEKLREANAQAEELINKYGLWNDYTIDSETGAYIIDEGKLASIQEQKDTAALEAKKNVSAGNILSNYSKLETTQAKIQDASYWDEFWFGNWDGQKYLNEDELNTITSKMADSDVIFDSNMSDEQFLEAIKGIDGLGDIAAENAEGLKKFKDELIGAAEVQKQYNDTLKNESEKIIATDIKQNQGDDIKAAFGKDFKEGTTDAVAKIMAESSEERTNYSGKLEQALNDANIADLEATDKNDLAIADKYGGDMSYEDLTKEYAKLQGYSDEELANVTFTDKDWKGTMKTESGETILEGVLYEDMVRALKTAEIQKQVSDETSSEDQAAREAQAEALGTMVQSFNSEIEGLGDAVLTSMTAGKDADGNYNLDLSSTFSELSSQEQVDEYKNLDATQLLEKLGMSEQDIINAGFESAKDFEEAFDEGLGEWTLEKHEDALQAKVDGILSEGASKYGLDEEVLKKQAKLIQENVEGLEDNAEAAAQMAIMNQRMNKGVNTLTDNWKDWKKTLKGTDKTTQDYAEALVGAENAMKDILNLADDAVIPEDFLQTPENLDLLDEIANGSEEAVEKLGFNLTKAQVDSLEFSSEIQQNLRDAFDPRALSAMGGLEEAFNTIKTNAVNAINGIQEAFNGLQPGATLTGEKAENFANALNDYARMTGMSVEQMQGMLNQMQVHAEVTTTEKKINSKVPKVEKERKILSQEKDDEGNIVSYKWTETAKTVGYEDAEEVIQVAQINTDEPVTFTKVDAGTITPSVTSGGKNSGGGGGGGGNKGPTKPKKVEKTDHKDIDEEIERYQYIDEVLDDMSRTLDNLGEAKDEAWGPARIAAIEAETEALKKYNAKQKEKLSLVKADLATDKQKLKDAAAAAGVVAEFDDAGRLMNPDELKRAFATQWNNTVDTLDDEKQTLENESATISDMEDGDAKSTAEEAHEDKERALDDKYEDADELYDDNMEFIDQYTESLNLAEDIQQDILDNERKIKENNYEKIMYKIEYKVEVNDRELEILDNKISRMEDDFYKTAEVMAKIQDKSKFYESGDVGILDDLKTAADELETSFRNGEITQADYIEGLGEIQDKAMDNVDALYEMNSQMKEYYADVIDEGISKIQEMTDHFDHLTSKLQHYSSILSLMGHEQNYELQNNLLQGQIDVLNDKIETSKATMAMLDSSLKSAQANYENATSEEDKEYWRERIVQISQALNEEEDAYLSYVEEVGDAANQILTNSIEKAFKEAELSMTNNLGFDSILADMERMNTLTDEFLTNTNKMYETNKMISSAQLAIDKTQNAQAKQKYQDYIKYIEQLQVSGNLTQTELQTAQARYKVLEAEIALEEAKNAKSEVRLTRDSEGNFGYVYTANQDEVANATQNYLDAQNELYNVGLENTKAYREKTVQLQQSTLEELKQLEIDFRVDHIISEEQYNQQKAAILETSNALLETYTEQFNLAQFTMATTSYNALMEEDTNFYNGQLSRNKEHTSLMEANDTEYYNGIKTTAETTQTTLETNLANFNAGVLSKEDAQYLARTEKDTKYYTSLRDLADGKAKEIDGIFNTNEDSLANKLKVDFYNNLDTALSNCRDATSTWQSNMQPLVEAVGVSFDGGETGEGLTQKIANTLQESKDLKDYITGEDGLIKGIEKEWKAVEDATLKWQAHWDKIQEVIGAYDELIGRTQQLIQAQAGPIANEPQPPEDPNANSGDGGGSSGSSDGGTNAVEAQASTLASQAMEIVQKVHNGTIKQDSSGWRNNAKAAGYSDDAIALALKAFNDSKAGGGYSYYYDKALELVQSYDTGGYTGEWGPEGRMAMLHEKELVLNAKDTENFLTATSMLREISQMLDNNALLASLGMINLSAMTLSTEADKVLQQEVTIHADFPNVTDHNEIEMAIDNLINAASQYANKK